MASIVMNMSSYAVEREVVVTEEYGDEVLCAGWNPQLALASQDCGNARDRHMAFPSELADVDVDAFLKKMYALPH